MPGDAKAQNDRLRTLVLRNRQTIGKLQEAIKNLDSCPPKKLIGGALRNTPLENPRTRTDTTL